jgi:hypothetical protein
MHAKTLLLPVRVAWVIASLLQGTEAVRLIGVAEMECTKFLNVDIDLHAESGLGPLLVALQPALLVLSEEQRRASLELASFQPESINEAVLEIFKIFQALPVHAQFAWMQCERRCFNVGIQAGSKPQQVTYCLSDDALESLRVMKGMLEITIYAPNTDCI